MPYVRLVLDDVTTASVRDVGERVQAQLTAAGGQPVFFHQLDPRAQLGCHPYHITLVAGLGSYTDDEVQAVLTQVAPMFPPVKGTILEWGIRGTLHLVVDCPAAFEIASCLHRLLPRGKLWQPPQHITVGRFAGFPHERAHFLDKVQSHFRVQCSEQFPFQGLAIEYENDTGHSNPVMCMLTSSHAPSRSLTNDNAATMVARACTLACSLSSFRTFLQRRSANFCVLKPLDESAVLAAVQPIHDLLQRAFASEPLAMLAALESHTNAYRNGLDCIDTNINWHSKLHDLHISVDGHGSSGRIVSEGIANATVCEVHLSAVHQSYYTGMESHRGHVDTPSSLLCYAQRRDKAWIALHFHPGIMPSGLRPSDGYYYHLSLAKLSAGQTSQPARGRGGSCTWRQGDWHCRRCDEHNFASRWKCYACGVAYCE